MKKFLGILTIAALILSCAGCSDKDENIITLPEGVEWEDLSEEEIMALVEESYVPVEPEKTKPVADPDEIEINGVGTMVWDKGDSYGSGSGTSVDLGELYFGRVMNDSDFSYKLTNETINVSFGDVDYLALGHTMYSSENPEKTAFYFILDKNGEAVDDATAAAAATGDYDREIKFKGVVQKLGEFEKMSMMNKAEIKDDVTADIYLSVGEDENKKSITVSAGMMYVDLTNFMGEGEEITANGGTWYCYDIDHHKLYIQKESYPQSNNIELVSSFVLIKDRVQEIDIIDVEFTPEGSDE